MWPFKKKTKESDPKIEEEKNKKNIELQVTFDPVTKKLFMKPKEPELKIADPELPSHIKTQLVRDEPPAMIQSSASREEIYDAFISSFRYPQEIGGEESWLAGWSGILGKPYDKAIDNLVDEGLLRPAGIKDKLDLKITVDELKRSLRERGLKVSGKKDELLNRYIEAMPREAEVRVSTLGDMYVCTSKGRERAEIYQNRSESRRLAAEQDVKSLLAESRIDEAAEAANRYNQSLPFPKDKVSFLEDDVKAVLGIKSAPGLTEAEVVEGRIKLAAELIWTGWIRSDDPMTIFALNRMIRHRSIKELRQYAESEFVVGVEVVCSDDSCKKCKFVASKKYPLDKAPLLPIDGCTHEDGCRCFYSAVYD